MQGHVFKVVKRGIDLTLCLETKKDKEFDQVIEWNINHFDINVNLVRIEKRFSKVLHFTEVFRFFSHFHIIVFGRQKKARQVRRKFSMQKRGEIHYGS